MDILSLVHAVCMYNMNLLVLDLYSIICIHGNMEVTSNKLRGSYASRVYEGENGRGWTTLDYVRTYA